MIEGHALLVRVTEFSQAMGFQSGIPAVNIAGHTLSFLAGHPEHIDRYMKEGNELWIDGTITYKGGCLTYLAGNGKVLSPSIIRDNEH